MHHLRAEDAYASAVMHRLRVPDLQQDLLRELQSRELPIARVSLPGVRGCMKYSIKCCPVRVGFY